MRFFVFRFPFFAPRARPDASKGASGEGKKQKTGNKKPFPALTLSAALSLSACSHQESPDEENFVPNTGQIQILNGCGKPGAAEHFRNFLTDQGFDIIEFGNAVSWNYQHTMVVARTDNLPVARDLAKVMGTDNLIHLFDPLAMVDATVFVGKDYEELIKRWQKRRPH